MRPFITLVKKDLKGYFDQPTGYILLVIFLGLTSYLFFRSALVTKEASLRILFDYMPWVLAVFVPAATMRLMAEEQRDGTLEILLTQPTRTWAVMFAKVLAGLIFVGVGIALTVGIPLGLMTAGNMDEGAIIAQYLGTIFLTASFVSIGLFTSSLTRNQMVAFVISLSLIMVIMFGGLPLVTLALPSAVAILVQDLSPLTHFSGMARGVLDLRDVLYFVALLSTFLSGTYLMIRGKSVSHHSMLYRNLQMGVGGLVVISLLVGWFGGSIEGRLDLTEKKLYTLSPGSEEVLSDLDDVVTIKMFSTKDPPVQLALRTREVNDLLDDLVAMSNGKLRVVRRFADEDEESEEEARHSFVIPVTLSLESQGDYGYKIGYLGLGMTYANCQESIPYIDTTDGLEYQIVSNIRRMTQRWPKIVAFLYGHGEKSKDASLVSLRNQLERNLDVREITQTDVLRIAGTDVLVVPGPADYMDPYEQEAIDVYLANGVKALFLIDPVIVDTGFLTGSVNNFSMADYLEKYGVKIHTDVVFDNRSNETITFSGPAGPVYLAYPYWPRVPTLENKVSGGVSYAVLPWASSLEITEPTDKSVEVEVTPLLETMSSAGVDEEFWDLTVQSQRVASVSEEELGQRLMAVALTGTRCPPLSPNCEKDPSKPFRIIVATDSDWITEALVSQEYQFPENLQMAINWIDWLTQEDALAAIRSKGESLRPLVFDGVLHRNLVQYGNIVGAPALFVVLGLLRYFIRRKTTRKVYAREG